MRRILVAVLALAANVRFALCMVSKGRVGHGLIGYGINMYQPFCASGCRDSIKKATLNCTPPMVHGAMGGHSMATTSPECYATDDAFLTTLAYCVSQHCNDLPVWKIEKWWKANVAGNQESQPDPKWTYQETLARIITPPVTTYIAKSALNATNLVSNATWLGNYNGDREFETLEITTEKFGYVQSTHLDPVPAISDRCTAL